MSRQIHRFDPPERFVAGTVGEPGQRTFYLQARSGSRICSVVLEKQQVSVLADRLDSLLDQIVYQTRGQTAVPAVVPATAEDLAPLELPLDEEFRVGTMTLGWDEQAQQVVIEAYAVPVAEDEQAAGDSSNAGDDDPDEPGFAAPGDREELQEDSDGGEGDVDAGDESADVAGDVLEVHIDGATARAFVVRARALVAAGRAACPLCSQPLDPSGHICPRQNGYRRR